MGAGEGAGEVIAMDTPTFGQLHIARTLLTTGRTPRRQLSERAWRRFFNGAVVLTFVFFLFM